MIDPRTPVLVGVSQYVQKCAPEEAKSLKVLLAEAGRRAAADAAGKTEGDPADAILRAVDTVVTVSSTVDEPAFDTLPVGRLPNPPKTVADALGLKAKRLFSTYTGGNTPQMLVNHFAEEIAEGRSDAVLCVGGEALASLLKQVLNGVDMNHWGDENPPIDKDHILGSSWPGVSDHERAHGLGFPTNTYPIFESAMRHEAGRSVEEHQLFMGKLMAPFTRVAAQNPYAWFQQERTPEELAVETPDNRMVGAPYTKYLNSVIRVDQGGAWLMTSVEKARALDIPEDKWVYLHGCADIHDTLMVTHRDNLYSSPAISVMGEEAFAMAGWTMEDIDFIDLYSCFPSAVEAGCEGLGLATDDPRGLTITGGLPYFGGAGNAYVLCSIAEMVERVRAKPGSKGLVTANGWYLTKHAMGLYSTEPIEGPWKRKNPKEIQAAYDARPHPELDENPSGTGTVEGYTVVHSRTSVRMGIVIGKLANGKRFVANVPMDKDLLERMKREDLVGVSGQVEAGDAVNIFTPDW